MPEGGFGYNEQFHGDSPRRWGCPRCGAAAEEACDPIGPHKHATILSYHSERGMSPGDLQDAGYQPYVLADDSGFRLHLWRKPTQRAVRRAGWLESTAQ